LKENIFLFIVIGMPAVRGPGGRFVRKAERVYHTSMLTQESAKEKTFFEKAAPAMTVLIVVMAFALGSLWSKVKYLEQGGTSAAGTNEQAVGGQPTAKGPTGDVQAFLAKVKGYAVKAGMDADKLVKCVESGEKTSVVAADMQQGGSVGVGGTPAFFINGKFLGGAFPVASFKEIIDRELNGTGSKNYKDYKDSNLLGAGASTPVAFIAEPKNVDVGKALFQGPAGARVTIVGFSDFQCPYCERGYLTIKQVLKDYDGKVRFVFKNFPLSQIHPYAEAAAEAFECAKDQGKAWELHDQLFDNQSDWSSV
jgi:protein-disulfide isomerase